ncbi:MAG: COX15/CtaA family protein [Anaerolineales bacterium]|nr:COX15/CtaA family protein [Anaerolineales bacterium]
MKNLSSFSKFAWGVLVINIAVILWGALVRATGSGAGCGSHWPLCDGEVIPRAPQLETIIEFTHRLTSGVAFFLVVGLLIWGYKKYGKGHQVRIGLFFSMLFMITEALVGAGLVLFELVGENVSIERAVVMAVHLINTLLLLASLTLTAWWSSGGAPIQLRGKGATLWALGLGIVGMLILGASGAVTALGDTLFPVGAISDSSSLSPTAQTLISLRIFHPAIAIIVSVYLIVIVIIIRKVYKQSTVVYLSYAFTWLLIAQLGLGYLNVLLYAPIWMQLIHLFMADVVWIVLILFSANVLSQSKEASLVETTVGHQSLTEETLVV